MLPAVGRHPRYLTPGRRHGGREIRCRLLPASQCGHHRPKRDRPADRGYLTGPPPEPDRFIPPAPAGAMRRPEARAGKNNVLRLRPDRAADPGSQRSAERETKERPVSCSRAPRASSASRSSCHSGASAARAAARRRSASRTRFWCTGSPGSRAISSSCRDRLAGREGGGGGTKTTFDHLPDSPDVTYLPEPWGPANEV